MTGPAVAEENRRLRNRPMPRIFTIKSRCSRRLQWSSCCATAKKSTAIIEWYDKSCLKVTRNGQSNLLIYKPAIKYMFKEGENSKK